jgi:hypothetical protein
VKTSGTYDVRVTDGNGCIGRDTVVVTVDTIPVVALGLDQTFCADDSVTFDAGSPGATYLWSTSETSQTVKVKTVGSYDVEVTNSNGCVGRDTVVVTISALPIVALGVDQEFCADKNATLDAANAGADYLWSTTEIGQTITVSTTGIYDVLVTDVNGCVARDTIGITVNGLPIVSVNSVSICSGDPVATFTATAPSAMSQLWSANGSGSDL